MSVLVNPFGTIYNPHSIHKSLQYAMSNGQPDPRLLLQRQDVFLHYDFHSQFSSLRNEELEDSLRSVITKTHMFLKTADCLILTYGTAWVYEHNVLKEIVANCHKIPQGAFKKFLLTQKQILDSFETVYVQLKAFNQKLKVVLTVSPVRHLKDTLELSSVSKSILRVACHTLSQQHQDVEYFPSYEIMLDDLRDYRFYKSDMIHPSDVAEEYIWEQFGKQYFEEDLQTFLWKWKDIRSMLDHRPFHPGSAAHQKFLLETIKKLEELKSVVNVDEEISRLKNQLADHGA
jgi:hypothetical protein